MQSIRVMTFNLRLISSQDGINRMENRTGRVRELLRRESPDLIGFQEASGWMWEWLEHTLSPEYCFLGCGRNADRTGEGTPVAFRRSRFRLLGMECFWLSDTPALPGSRYEASDQSPCPRMAVSLLLQERESGELLTFVNTHTDHRGAASRRLAMQQLAVYLRQSCGHRILLGDLNAVPQSEEIGSFLERTADLEIRDVSAAVGPTFHGFGRAQPFRKIDYIFTDLHPLSCHAAVEHPSDGIYYSDHFAVCAELCIGTPPCKEGERP